MLKERESLRVCVYVENQCMGGWMCLNVLGVLSGLCLNGCKCKYVWVCVSVGVCVGGLVGGCA